MPRGAKVSDDEILDMYYAKPPITMFAICAELGIYPQRVYAAIDRKGFKRRSEDPDYMPVKHMGAAASLKDDATYQDIVMRYLVKEQTAKEIAAELDLSYGRVLRMLQNARVQIVPGRRGRKARGVKAAIARDLVGDKMSLEEIAVKHAVTADVVLAVARRLGEIRKTFQSSKWGRTEAIVEEVMARLREEFGMQHVEDERYQLKLPGL